MINTILKKEITEKIFFYAYIICFVIIIYLRNVLNINIPIVITTFLTIVYMSISNTSVPKIYAFLIPFRSTIQGNYILMASVLIYFIREKKNLKIDKSILLIFIIIIIELLNCFNEFSSLKDYLTFAISMLLIYFIVYSKDDAIEKKGIINNYIIGTILATVVFLFKTFTTVQFVNFINLGYRLGTFNNIYTRSIYEMSYNSNELALYVVVAIAMLVFWGSKKKINMIVYYIILVYFIIIGVFTMSRAFLLTSLIIFAIYFYDNRKKLREMVASISVLIIAFIAVIGFTSLFSYGIINNFKQRFEEKDLSGGRLNIIKAYNEIIFSSPRKFLIGSGIQNYNIKNNYLFSSHNAIQEAFIGWGVIGGITFLILMFKLYKKSKVNKIKYDLTTYIPFISLLLMMQTIPFISQGTIILMFYIVLAPFSIIDEGNLKNKEENSSEKP